VTTSWAQSHNACDTASSGPGDARSVRDRPSLVLVAPTAGPWLDICVSHPTGWMNCIVKKSIPP